MSIRSFSRVLAAAGLVSMFLFTGDPAVRLQAAESLATYTFSSVGWATFGLALPQGKATSGVKVGSLATQTDVKVRYPDNSIKYAVVTARIPATGSYDITADVAPTGQVSTSLPTASVEINVDGKAYVAQLPSSVPASWLNGPLVREGRSVQTFAGATGPAAALRATFDVRSYSDGSHRVDFAISNTLNVTTARDVAYGVNFRLGGTSVFSRSSTRTPGANPFSAINSNNEYTVVNHGLAVGDTVRLTSGTGTGKLRVVTSVVDANTVALSYPWELPLPISWEKLTFVQPYLTRWHKTFATPDFTEASVTPDFRPFQLAGAVPSYLSLVGSWTRSTTGPWFEPFRIGSLIHPFAAPGARPELGLYPDWAAQYIYHRRPDQRAYVLAMGGNVAGAASLHIDDPDGSMLLLDNHPDFNLNLIDPTGATGMAGAGGNGLEGGIGIIYPAEVGAAHTPALSFIPYLITGDRFYLDELKYWANAAMLTVSWVRNGAAGLLTGQQIRGIAWGLRDIADAAAYTPQDDPHRAYFVQKTNNNIAELDRMAAAEPDRLGGSLFGQPVDTLQQVFMQSYAAWSFSHVGQQGFATPQYVRRLVTYWNNMYNANPGFDRRYVESYQFAVIYPTGASFSSFAEMYDYNYNKRPYQPWKDFPPPPQAGGVSYNKVVFVLMTLAKQLNLPNADVNYQYVFNAVEGDTTTQKDLTLESQHAISTSVSLTQGPSTPTGLRIVQ